VDLHRLRLSGITHAVEDRLTTREQADVRRRTRPTRAARCLRRTTREGASVCSGLEAGVSDQVPAHEGQSRTRFLCLQAAGRHRLQALSEVVYLGDEPLTRPPVERLMRLRANRGGRPLSEG
jgi:hypothetical protein